MSYFLTANSLSEILEESQLHPVIIFKYSSECNSSERLSKKLEEKISEKIITAPIYKMVVQEQSVLSGKITEWFNIKHESPQIIIIENGKITYTAHHNSIKIEGFIFQ